MTDNNTPNFVDGLRVSRPRENAPDFIKATFGAKVDDLVAWLQKNVNEKGWVNFDLKEGRKKDDGTLGNLYCAINDYKKEDATTPTTTDEDIPVIQEDAPVELSPEYGGDQEAKKINPSDIPF